MTTNDGTSISRRRFIAAGASAAVVGLGVMAWPLAFHALSPSLTGEAKRLAELLRIEPGLTVGEIGAGKGKLTVEIARLLGPGGRMYSTELNPSLRETIRHGVRKAGLTNVTVMGAAADRTNLPPASCDAIYMRGVYHHIGDSETFARSLRESVRAGGLLAIIDFEPGAFWHLCGSPPEGTPANHGGHGMPRDRLVREMAGERFEVVRSIPRWGGYMYLVVFRAA